MQFYCTEKYREYRGYVFCNHQPVTIHDKATENLLLREHTFRRYYEKADEVPETDAGNQGSNEEVEANDEKNAGEKGKILGCPKCGKVCVKGQFMHNKYCKA